MTVVEHSGRGRFGKRLINDIIRVHDKGKPLPRTADHAEHELRKTESICARAR